MIFDHLGQIGHVASSEAGTARSVCTTPRVRPRPDTGRLRPGGGERNATDARMAPLSQTDETPARSSARGVRQALAIALD